jgi:Repeat of unknown function (DUF5648)
MADNNDTRMIIPSSSENTSEAKSWTTGPRVFIGYDKSTIITTIYTGWAPDNSTNTFACPIQSPLPVMNIAFFRDGVLTYGVNGINAQGGTIVNTPRDPECTRTFYSNYTDGVAGGFDAPPPGTYSATVTTVQGTNSTTLALNACATPTVYGTTPMLLARSEASTDNFYTISNSQISIAVNQAGFTSKGAVYRVPTTSSVSSSPWYRLYKYLPDTAHIYTSSLSQARDLRANFGYTAEGEEGRVYTKQVLGTVPLYLFAKLYGNDWDFLYSTTASPGASWVPNGVVGYVCNL